ncbi:MAG: hypothetical protein H6629_07490 [Calditrichae bacterium]|nr:hypothetical protein [Calditrichia bacterium]
MRWHHKWVFSGFRDRGAHRRKLDWAEKSIRLAPDNPDALAVLAHSYLTSGVSIDSTYAVLSTSAGRKPNSEALRWKLPDFSTSAELVCGTRGSTNRQKQPLIHSGCNIFTIAAAMCNYIDIGDEQLRTFAGAQRRLRRLSKVLWEVVSIYETLLAVLTATRPAADSQSRSRCTRKKDFRRAEELAKKRCRCLRSGWRCASRCSAIRKMNWRS